MSQAKIFTVIPKIMKEVGAIGKKGYNEYDKYYFRSIDSVYDALQMPLANNGLFFLPEVIDDKEERIQSAKGTDMVRVKLRVKYTIYADDGSSVSATVCGEAIDRSDKATNKALTAAFKYMLIQIFCIAIENQDDADKESPQIQSNKPTTATKDNGSNGAPKCPLCGALMRISKSGATWYCPNFKDTQKGEHPTIKRDLT